MADAAANTAPVNTAALAHIYGRAGATPGDGFVKYPANQFAHAVGFTGADKGKLWTPDANGDVTTVAAGTDGQVLGYSGGLPTPVDAPQTFRYVASSTASGAASVDFTTGFSSDYDEYIFDFLGVYPATDAAKLRIRISEDGGSSYHATNYSMAAIQVKGSGSFYPTNAETEVAIDLAAAMDNAAASAGFGRVHVFVTTTKTGFTGMSNHLFSDASGGITHIVGGSRATTARTNAVRFLMSSGNINGTIRMYRVKNS